MERYKSLLEIQHYLLSSIYANMLKWEDHLLIIDNSSVHPPSSNTLTSCNPALPNLHCLFIEKRARDDISGGITTSLSIPITEDQIEQKGLKLLEDLKQTELDSFMKGEVKRVTLHKIKKAIVLTEAMLLTAYKLSLIQDNPETLVKILSEIREYDLALDLALSSKKLARKVAAYPVMLMMKEY